MYIAENRQEKVAPGFLPEHRSDDEMETNPVYPRVLGHDPDLIVLIVQVVTVGRRQGEVNGLPEQAISPGMQLTPSSSTKSCAGRCIASRGEVAPARVAT